MLRDLPQETAAPNVEEVGVIDILLVLAENIKLLLVAPLVAGLLALGVVQFLPPVYESVALLNGRKVMVIDSVEAELFEPSHISALVTARSTKALAFEKLQASEQGAPVAGMFSHATVSSSLLRNASTVAVSVQAGSPDAAQQILQAVVASTLEQTRPSDIEQERLQKNLQADTAALVRARAVEAEIAKQLQHSTAKMDSVGRVYADLLPTLTALEEKIAVNQAKLDGLGEASVLDAPSFPAAPVKPRKVLIVLLAALGVGLLTLVYVFVKCGLQQASQQTQYADKLRRIRLALKWRSS